jgi:hypothetical protein
MLGAPSPRQPRRKSPRIERLSRVSPAAEATKFLPPRSCKSKEVHHAVLASFLLALSAFTA